MAPCWRSCHPPSSLLDVRNPPLSTKVILSQVIIFLVSVCPASPSWPCFCRRLHRLMAWSLLSDNKFRSLYLPASTLALSLAHVTEYRPYTHPWRQLVQGGGGERMGENLTSSPSVFPLQLFLRKWWWRCFEAAYIMWQCETERMPSGPILPQFSGTNWARSSHLPKALYIYYSHY